MGGINIMVPLERILDNKIEIPDENRPDDWKMREFAHQGALKRQILELFEAQKVTTLSRAAELVRISKYTAYKWKADDLEFAEELKIAKELVADRLEEEILEQDKLPGVTARIFLLNGLRPGIYKDRRLELTNPRLESLLAKLREAGQQPLITEGNETTDPPASNSIEE